MKKCSPTPTEGGSFTPFSPPLGESEGAIPLGESEGAQQRIALAVDYFRRGFNCSQSVCAAFADLYGYTEEQALRMAASFGGGIGRMRETCGAACGMFLLAGLDCGATRGEDREGKAHNYAVVQQLARTFRQRNGSLICAELLGLRPMGSPPPLQPAIGDPMPEERTAAYYIKRPCTQKVEEAARIFAEYYESVHGAIDSAPEKIE